MPSACDAVRGITTKRRACVRLFPLPIKHQTSYIKYGPMDPFSYLSVLISIILALRMTRVLTGLGEMLKTRSRRRLYWVRAVWVVNLFLYLVVARWIFYRWRNQQSWTFQPSPILRSLRTVLAGRFRRYPWGLPHLVVALRPLYFISCILFFAGRRTSDGCDYAK
jgi:hypothetical protein